MSQLNNPHDRFFKAIFGRSEVAREFLQRFLPAEVAARIDWRGLQPEKDQFLDSALQGHANDWNKWGQTTFFTRDAISSRDGISEE